MTVFLLLLLFFEIEVLQIIIIDSLCTEKKTMTFDQENQI